MGPCTLVSAMREKYGSRRAGTAEAQGPVVGLVRAGARLTKVMHMFSFQSLIIYQIAIFFDHGIEPISVVT